MMPVVHVSNRELAPVVAGVALGREQENVKNVKMLDFSKIIPTIFASKQASKQASKSTR
ncbi:MAG: hypothetical protein LBS49_00075 [Candidatus Accumulibacter sp.]|jgi:hypothetical protein|nr:hypothetical protein [Accumulibacter sp.]